MCSEFSSIVEYLVEYLLTILELAFMFVKFHRKFEFQKLLTNFKKWLGLKKMFMLNDNDEIHKQKHSN